MAQNIDHRTPDLTIYKRVLNRLPFLTDDSTNQQLISNWTLEVMWQLEPCFKVANQVEPADIDRVGQEQYYDVTKQSIIADVVALYILYSLGVARAGAGVEHIPDAAAAAAAVSSTNGGLFVKKAKAGSAEAEFEQVDINKTALFAFKAKELEAVLISTIKRKAGFIGCPFDVCNDCTLKWFNAVETGFAKPFIVTKDCGCP